MGRSILTPMFLPEDELQKLEDAIESFKTNETFDSMEADLIELCPHVLRAVLPAANDSMRLRRLPRLECQMPV